MAFLGREHELYWRNLEWSDGLEDLMGLKPWGGRRSFRILLTCTQKALSRQLRGVIFHLLYGHCRLLFKNHELWMVALITQLIHLINCYCLACDLHDFDTWFDSLPPSDHLLVSSKGELTRLSIRINQFKSFLSWAHNWAASQEESLNRGQIWGTFIDLVAPFLEQRVHDIVDFITSILIVVSLSIIRVYCAFRIE